MPVWLTTMFANAASVATSSVYEVASATAFHDSIGDVETPDSPSAGARRVGAEGAPGVSVNCTSTECPMLPLAEPLTVTGYVPAAAAAVAARTRAASLPGPTGLGLNTAGTPTGSTLVARLSGALNPDWRPTSAT